MSFVPPTHATAHIPVHMHHVEMVTALNPLGLNEIDSDSESLAEKMAASAPLPATHHGPGHFPMEGTERLSQSPFHMNKGPIVVAHKKTMSRTTASSLHVTSPRDDDVDMVATLPAFGLDEAFVSDDEDDGEEYFGNASIKHSPTRLPVVPPLEMSKLTMENRVTVATTRSDAGEGRHVANPPSTSPERVRKILRVANVSQLEVSPFVVQSLTAREESAKDSLMNKPTTTCGNSLKDSVSAAPRAPPVPVDDSTKTITATIDFTSTRADLDKMASSFALPISPITKRSPRRKPSPNTSRRSKHLKVRPFCNYKKFEEMQKVHGGRDWHIYVDGSPYVSKADQMKIRERGDPKLLITSAPFRAAFGKGSCWPLPDNHGVRCGGPYKGHEGEAGLVDRDQRGKWLSPSGWVSIGDREKPHYRRRIARGFGGFHTPTREEIYHNEHLKDEHLDLHMNVVQSEHDL